MSNRFFATKLMPYKDGVRDESKHDQETDQAQQGIYPRL